MRNNRQVPRVLINGRDTKDETEYLDYTGNNVIDLEIAKTNIGRFIYKYINKTPCEVQPMTSFILETINDELYIQALFTDNGESNTNYIRILANRISILLSLHGDTTHNIRDLVAFLYDQIR